MRVNSNMLMDSIPKDITGVWIFIFWKHQILLFHKIGFLGIGDCVSKLKYANGFNSKKYATFEHIEIAHQSH